jgi:hypothetical protein
MTIDARRVQPETPPQIADLDLVEVLQRLDDLPRTHHFLNDGNAVVMRLDDVGALGATGFDGVGIDRPLPEQHLAQAELRSFALEHLDEGVADGAALFFGIRESLECTEELR